MLKSNATVKMHMYLSEQKRGPDMAATVTVMQSLVSEAWIAAAHSNILNSWWHPIMEHMQIWGALCVTAAERPRINLGHPAENV